MSPPLTTSGDTLPGGTLADDTSACHLPSEKPTSLRDVRSFSTTLREIDVPVLAYGPTPALTKALAGLFVTSGRGGARKRKAKALRKEIARTLDIRKWWLLAQSDPVVSDTNYELMDTSNYLTGSSFVGGDSTSTLLIAMGCTVVGVVALWCAHRAAKLLNGRRLGQELTSLKPVGDSSNLKMHHGKQPVYESTNAKPIEESSDLKKQRFETPRQTPYPNALARLSSDVDVGNNLARLSSDVDIVTPSVAGAITVSQGGANTALRPFARAKMAFSMLMALQHPSDDEITRRSSEQHGSRLLNSAKVNAARARTAPSESARRSEEDLHPERIDKDGTPSRSPTDQRPIPRSPDQARGSQGRHGSCEATQVSTYL